MWRRRRERLYLLDIVEAADAVRGFLEGRDKRAFLEDDLLQSGVLQKLTVIGEAAARLPAEFKSGHAGIPWSKIVAFRNIAVHAYFAVDWDLVWDAATGDAPKLRREVGEILAAEFPEDREEEP